jgi:hypothetical protein
MTALRLGVRDRRALRIGILLAVPVLVINLAVRPYLAELADLRERVAARRELLARELALISHAERFPHELGRAQTALGALGPRLFIGADEIARTGALVYYVGERATRNRVLMQRVETRPSEPTADSLLALRVDVQGMSDLEGILGLLHALEGGPKLVRIERLSIGTAGRLGLSAGAPAEEVLSFSATITGFAGGSAKVREPSTASGPTPPRAGAGGAS